MKLRERVLRWAIRDYLILESWEPIIKVFVEEFRKRYYEDNNATAYFAIEEEVAKQVGYKHNKHKETKHAQQVQP